MIYLAGIQEDSIVDGPGIRTAFFAQGCPHRCHGCHNPETWAFEGGTGFDPEKFLEIVKANPLCHGVTFSGGEPFAQAEDFAKFAGLLKESGYEVASYSGYTFEELYDAKDARRDLLESIDVLIDGPYEESERSLELAFKGSRNQRIINVSQSLAVGKAVIETSDRWLGN